MGIITNITIQNDDLNDIIKDPKKFVDELMNKINSSSKRKSSGLLTVNSLNIHS